MKPAPFSYYRTRSVPETVALLAGRRDGTTTPAGRPSLGRKTGDADENPGGSSRLPLPAGVQELATNGGGR